MNNKSPTIAAIIILLISLSLAFYITVYEQNSKIPSGDVEVFITKPPVDYPIFNRPQSVFINISSFLLKNLKQERAYLYSLVDSYEIEISDFWKEVLNQFEIFEYYKAYPEAFLRRLIYMPTFTGNYGFIEDNENFEKPIVYPDYDYRSIKYRVSLVPNTIDNMKAIIDYFYYRIKISIEMFQ